jgi:hypothetical protein
MFATADIRCSEERTSIPYSLEEVLKDSKKELSYAVSAPQVKCVFCRDRGVISYQGKPEPCGCGKGRKLNAGR